MTGEIAHEDYMSLFNDSQRRYRRNALCNIFDGFEEERISFLHHLAAEFISATDENGELVACTAVESPSSASSDSCCSSTSKDLDFPSKDNSEESSPSSSVDTARPSCLVGLTSCSSHSSSSSSSTTSPSSMSSQTSSSVASLSSSGEGKVRSCSSDTHGFTTSPTSSMCYNISFSRVRRNALHDLLETLTQDDIEKLKNLYQTTLSTAYSLNPFSEQTQSPIRDVKKLAQDLSTDEHTMKLIVDGLLQPINYDLRDKYEKPLFRTEITSLKDLTTGQKLSGRVSNVTHFGAFVDVGVGIDGLLHISKMKPDLLAQKNRSKLELGDRIEVMVDSLDLQKLRIGLSLCKFL